MYTKELEVAIKAALLAKDAVLKVYNSQDFGVEIKDDNSPVTKADKASDKIIRELLQSEFPEYAMLTEESLDDKNRLNNDYVWIVDPVDGTKEFVSRNGEFTINIGLSYKHEPVLGVILAPVSGELYYAIKGVGAFYKKDFSSKPIQIHVNDKTNDLTCLISRCHFNETEQNVINKHNDRISRQVTIGASLKGCAIAKGDAEISYRFSSFTKEWDTCAMQAIVECAGGFILKFDGTPITYNREDVYNRDGYIIINDKRNFLL